MPWQPWHQPQSRREARGVVLLGLNSFTSHVPPEGTCSPLFPCQPARANGQRVKGDPFLRAGGRARGGTHKNSHVVGQLSILRAHKPSRGQSQRQANQALSAAWTQEEVGKPDHSSNARPHPHHSQQRGREQT